MAEYRKIIKFGGHSLIISLPKTWLKNHHLEAGDSVLVHQREQDLLVTPTQTTTTTTPLSTVLFIDDDELAIIKRRVLHAYINNYDLITLKGKTIMAKSKAIRTIMHQLVALEIIEESPERIQAKCYLNMQDIDISHLIRKIDAIIRSMLQDALEELADQNNHELISNISDRDDDVNRLSYLIMRTVRYLLDNPQATKQDMTNGTLLNYWDLTQRLERTGDEVKRACRFLPAVDPSHHSQLRKLLKESKEHYEEIMKATYRNDAQAAYHLSLKRQTMTAAFADYRKQHEDSINVAKALDHVESLFYRIDALTTVIIERAATQKPL